MKRLFVLLIVILFAVFTATDGFSAISGSAHDLSTTGGLVNKSSNETRVCIFCHSPHQSGTTADPLWNHADTATGAFGTYESPTFNASASNGGSIADIAGGGMNTSMMCMSCHDGTVAVNNLRNPSNEFGQPLMDVTVPTELAATGEINPARPSVLGTDLTDDHPVNFDYFESIALGDTGLNNTSAVSQLLIGTKVQCASCHDVHNSNPGFSPLLRQDPAGSQLCLDCHAK